MRNLKKFLALVLAMMMALSLMVTVNASSFKDEGDVADEFAEAVEVLSSIGVFRGVDETTFKPQGNVTRAQMAAVVYRLATGDADDTRAHLYAEYANFSDVDKSAWYAGYVGYCSDAQIIKGYGDNTFKPNKEVTGYEALAMLLRAVGYGKNGEFEGVNWRINVGARATSEGLLQNVNNSNYAGTLNQIAKREMLAEISFQTALIPQVTYRYGTYEKTQGLVNSALNPSLGEKFFGLDSLTGIIVGNQQTGEKDTLLGVDVTWYTNAAGTGGYYGIGDKGSYIYATGAGTAAADPAPAVPAANATIKFNQETGLNLFGHKVTVWFDNRTDQGTQSIGATSVTYESTIVEKFNKTYTVVDKATKTDMVKASADPGTMTLNDTTTDNKVGKVAKDAGFKVDTTNGAVFSSAYDKLGNATAGDGTRTNAVAAARNTMAKPVFALISNSDDNTLDVVIALNVTLNRVDKVNNYATYKSVTMTTVPDNADIYRSADPSTKTRHLLVYGEDDIEVGAYEVLNKIHGTSIDRGITALNTQFYYGINKPTVEKEGTVTAISGTGKVTLSSGETIEQSVVWDATNTNCGNAALRIGAALTFVLDNYGKYVRVYRGGNTQLVGAYGYWAQEGIDGFKYYLQGVKRDGTIDTLEVTETTYKSVIANVPNTSRDIHFMGVADSGTTSQGSNVGIVNPTTSGGSGYELYQVNGNKVLSKNAWAKAIANSANGTTVTNKTWNANTNKLYLKNDGNAPDDSMANNIPYYFDSSNTKFYVISGWGSSLKVDSYNSLTDLLDGASSLEVEGWFTTDVNDTEHLGSQNNVVDAVYLTSVKRIQPTTFLYNKDAVGNISTLNPAMTDDEGAVQLQLRVAGDKDTSSILVNKIGANETTTGTPGSKTVNSSAALAANTFYTYTLNSDGYYVLTADSTYSWTGKTLTNANTAFGEISDGTDTIKAENAKVIDVTGVDHGITDYMSLRRAAEENSSITVDVLLTGAVSNNSGTAIVVYVTAVA